MRTTDTDPMSRWTTESIELFNGSFVEGNTEQCWLWTGSFINGVPRHYWQHIRGGLRRTVSPASVLMMTRIGVDIPEPYFRTRRRCEERACVNPHHRIVIGLQVQRQPKHVAEDEAVLRCAQDHDLTLPGAVFPSGMCRICVNATNKRISDGWQERARAYIESL